jgi:hypothetical protein
MLQFFIQVLIQQSFAAEITCRGRSKTLDDTRATPCPKMLPLEAINAYGVSQYGAKPSSLNLSLVTALGITRSERRTTYTQ